MAANTSSTAIPDLSKMPAVPLPPGVVFNPNNPDNYVSANIIMHSIVLSFMSIAVAIRIYTRAVMKKSMGIDDYLILLSWALAIYFSVNLAVATKYRFGYHIYDIPATDLLDSLKWLTISQWSYFPAALSIKLCILLGYSRIFQVKRFTNWMIWLGVLVITIFYVVCFLTDIFYCRPVQKAWNRALPGHCMSYAAFPWVTGIFNMISDFYILVTPMPPLLGLVMDAARKIRIIAVFGLGLFTCITSIMRFVVSVQNASNPDQTYVGAKYLYWSVLEINIGIICSCAVVFPTFFDSKAPRSLQSLVNKLLSTRTVTSQTELTLTGSRRSYDYEETPRAGWNFLSKPASQTSLRPNPKGQYNFQVSAGI